jgi:hypothetical protein
MLLLPVASWLLCIWQARQVGASWWVVLITILCVQLSKVLLESLASEGVHHEEMIGRGWPELLRVAVGITITVYVVQLVILDFSPSGSVSQIVMMLLVLACILDYDFPFSWRAHVIMSIMAMFAVTMREWGPFIQNSQPVFNFSHWLQFVLSIHTMLVGHTVGVSEHPVVFISPYVRIACTVSVALFTSMQYHKTALSVMILPCMFFREKNAIALTVMPILDSLCHSDLYINQEARRVFIVQQKQEILFYIISWCVVLGLWAHTRPSVLLWVQVMGGILYLASLRRYSNVVRILAYQQQCVKPTTERRRRPDEPELLAKMMQLPSIWPIIH